MEMVMVMAGPPARIRERHTRAHRVDERLAIHQTLEPHL
jgi:hypothetical protein